MVSSSSTQSSYERMSRKVYLWPKRSFSKVHISCYISWPWPLKLDRVGVRCPLVLCKKSCFTSNCLNLKKMLHQQCFIKSLAILTAPQTCQKAEPASPVDPAPLAQYGWKQSLVFFSKGYEFPCGLWVPFCSLRRAKWKLYAASHAEVGRRRASAPVILYY